LFCGTATAYVVAGGYAPGEKPLPGDFHRFKNGACFREPGIRAVNIGTLLIGGDSFLPYFGLTYGGKPGTTVLSVILGGGNYAATNVKLKLNHALTSGTFTAKDILTDIPLKGSFHC